MLWFAVCVQMIIHGRETVEFLSLHTSSVIIGKSPRGFPVRTFCIAIYTKYVKMATRPYRCCLSNGAASI